MPEQIPGRRQEILRASRGKRSQQGSTRFLANIVAQLMAQSLPITIEQVIEKLL